jgi:hypothetical protein
LYSRSGNSTTSASAKIACDFFIFLTQSGWVLAQVIECLDHVHFSHVLQFLAHLECDLTTNMLWNATLIHYEHALTTSVLWGTTLIYRQFLLLTKLQLPCQIISYLQDQRYFVQGKGPRIRAYYQSKGLHEAIIVEHKPNSGNALVQGPYWLWRKRLMDKIQWGGCRISGSNKSVWPYKPSL